MSATEATQPTPASLSWLMRAYTTIAIFWLIWLGALTWFGTHRQAVTSVPGYHPITIPDPVSVGEWLRAAAVSTAVALFVAFLAWLWLHRSPVDEVSE